MMFNINYINILFITSILLSIIDILNAENSIITNSTLLLVEKKGLKLVCDLPKDEPNRENARKFNWAKDGIPYNDFPDEDKQRVVLDSKDYSLVINEANKNDIGNYTCITGDGKKNATISVRTKPWIYPFEEFQKTNYKSANIIEGEKFFLKCEVKSDYDRDANARFYKFNESEFDEENKHLIKTVPIPEDDSDPHIRIERMNVTKVTLTIDNVRPSDRFYYVCKAENGISTTNNTILLRVKDKLGALWPFLGIVGEVVILCTIIFIYEKRRIKPDFDESDNDNNTEAKATLDRTGSKSQDVRQRK